MKLFSLIKLFVLLICFEIIISKENVNKTPEEISCSLKTDKEFEPISYLSQDLNGKYEPLPIVIDYFDINVPVKNKFIRNYDLYDISGLLTKSQREDADYTATLDNKTIIYNFKELKKTDICNYDRKQIFVISESKCLPLAGEMGNGNSWSITFDDDGKKLIQINLNPENNSINVTYLLKCSLIKNYNINTKKSYFNNTNNATNLLLYIETAYACPKYEYFVLLKWFDVSSFAFFFVLTLFCGYIIFSPSPKISFNTVLYFIICISLVSLVKILFPPGMKVWKIWLIVISCMIFSVILLILIYHTIKETYSKYCIGAFLGFLFGQYFYDLFIEVIYWNSLFFYLLFIIIFILAGIALSHFSLYTTIYLSCSFFGSYNFIRGVSCLLQYFPSEYLLVYLKINGEVFQLEKLITWRFYVYNCCIFILSAFAFISQYKYYSEKHSYLKYNNKFN